MNTYDTYVELESLRDRATGPAFKDIHKVLRGELSAVKAYKQSLESLEGDAEVNRIKKFCHDHEMAADYWKHQLRIEGELPESEPGVWGGFVKSLVGTAKLFGNTAALKALKEGESHGLSLYKDLLDSKDLSAAQKSRLVNTFIPNQESHIESIDALMKMH